MGTIITGMDITTPTSTDAISGLAALNGHWAVAALPEDDQEWLFGLVGQESQEGTASVASNGTGHIQRILSACEVVALDNLSTAEIFGIGTSAPSASAREASSQVFSICKMLPAPPSTWKRLLFILRSAAAARCGDRLADFNSWYEEVPEGWEPPEHTDAFWDDRLLRDLSKCWMRLLREPASECRSQVLSIIAGLREGREAGERGLFSRGSDSANQQKALTISSLYHLMGATELVADPPQIGDQESERRVSRHFHSSIEAAGHAGDVDLEWVVHWIRAATIRMLQRRAFVEAGQSATHE